MLQRRQGSSAAPARRHNSFCAHRWHRVHQVKFVPNAKESENAPDYRIVAGNFEIDAAWKKVSKADRPYLSATLDDPSFPATIYARLVEGEDGAHNLIWSRSKGD